MQRFVRILCVLGLLAVMPSAPAAAQSADANKAYEINSLFTGLCLAYLGDGFKIVDEAKAIGGKGLPAMVAQQFLSPHKGVALAVQGAAGLYMLGVTEQPSCLVIGPDANGGEVLRGFAAGPKRRKIGEEMVNGQVQHVFAVVMNDAQSGQQKKMIVMASMSPDAQTPGVFLTALPYGIARQAGITVDSWPE